MIMVCMAHCQSKIARVEIGGKQEPLISRVTVVWPFIGQGPSNQFCPTKSLQGLRYESHNLA